MRILSSILFLVLSVITAAGSQGPFFAERSFDDDWLFSKDGPLNVISVDFDDSGWRRLNVPHDWSSEGPFGGEYGSGNGFAPGGVGWYRKHFKLDASESNSIVSVEFDGIYDHSQVWINGHYIGGRPYGYSSFECVLTPLVKFGGRDNVIAVRVDHSRLADSRWYTGAGIYRHVKLRVTPKLRIGHWGVFVSTPEVSKDSALVRVETRIENDTGAPQSFSLESQIFSANGQAVGKTTTTTNLANGTNFIVIQEIRVSQPALWSPASPNLYKLQSSLDNVRTDTTFGIRSLRFDADKGFFLNNEPMKFKGVCVHHDAGTLGAAVPAKVWERRLSTLKEMGVNAIRTSHNPPAPELLDLCDRMGFLVKDEAFDEFTPGKNKWMAGWNSGQPSKHGYSEVFSEWSVTDARDMVRRDRNHPSVIMWSIGNEIDYPNDPFSHPVLGNEYRPENPPAQLLAEHARPLIAVVKQTDPTRPVTMAFARAPMSDAVGLGEMLDVVGYNYQEQRYAEDHVKYPKRFLYGSETQHGYDAWMAVRTNEFIAGQFLWTGIDYLGEARVWPNRGSSAGLLDVAGFKKPNAWFRQSLWSEKPMVYLCASAGGGDAGGRRRGGGQEHWNWPSNTTATVRCYANCPEVELTLNERSLGKQKLADAVQGVLTWRVPFEAGKLKAIGFANGSKAAEFELRTAGTASRITATSDVTSLSRNGHDICHLDFQIADENGVRIPDATNMVTFAVEGPAQLLGIENGDLNSPDTGKSGSRNVLRGRGLAIIQSKPSAGTVKITLSSPGLKAFEMTMQCE